MVFRGKLEKMQTTLGSSVLYQIPVGEELIGLNELIGNRLSLHYVGEINCIHCGRKTSKSFNQGY